MLTNGGSAAPSAFVLFGDLSNSQEHYDDLRFWAIIRIINIIKDYQDYQELRFWTVIRIHLITMQMTRTKSSSPKLVTTSCIKVCILYSIYLVCRALQHLHKSWFPSPCTKVGQLKLIWMENGFSAPRQCGREWMQSRNVKELQNCRYSAVTKLQTCRPKSKNLNVKLTLNICQLAQDPVKQSPHSQKSDFIWSQQCSEPSDLSKGTIQLCGKYFKLKTVGEFGRHPPPLTEEIHLLYTINECKPISL